MKFLCVCQYGHSRSVALTRVLHGLGQPAVAIGWMTSGNAIDGLSVWADKILILDSSYLRYVPQEQRHKVVDFHVGPDRWSNPYHADLLRLLTQMVREHFPELKGA